MNLETLLKKTFLQEDDFIYKEVSKYHIYYLESLCSSDKIEEFVIHRLSYPSLLVGHYLNGPHTKEVSTLEECITSLENGFTLIFGKRVYAIETKGDLVRSVTPPTTEPDLYGPKDSFTESIQTNLGLIKRRIKTTKLKSTNFTIGSLSKTNITLLCLEDKVDNDSLNKVISKLKAFSKDALLDISELRLYLSGENRTPLPTMQMSERPDKVVNALLNGRIIILMDTSCFALITPSYFVDFIHPVVDLYAKSMNVNLLKLVRFLCLILTLFLPALYIALITYNQGSIPLELLLNFASQREGVPFPSILECFYILLLCVVLRESDIRFPSSYGSSISIVGALVLGDAAVSAGIVSPIMIIIVAITYISSMLYSDMEFIQSFRYFRFLSLFMVGFFGLYGLYLSILFFLLHLSSLEVLGNAYTSPLVPFKKNFFFQSFLRKSFVSKRRNL